MTGQALEHIERLRGLAGSPRKDVAVALNLCEAYVVRLAKEAGIHLARSPRGKVRVEQLKDLAERGFTRQEAARELGISLTCVNSYVYRDGIKFLRSGLKTEAGVREKQMAALYRSGKTLQEIGDQYGITRERVRQITTRYFGLRAPDGGKSKTAEERRTKFEADRNAKSLKKWGCNWDQYIALRNAKKPVRKYAQQRRNAIHHRGISWELNLWQWWSIWQQSGRWEQRGRGTGYMMCRNNDTGPYAVGNVFIATGSENSSREHAKISGLPRGVSLRKGRYIAHRCVKGRRLYLGSHLTPELAHAAYLAAELL